MMETDFKIIVDKTTAFIKLDDLCYALISVSNKKEITIFASPLFLHLLRREDKKIEDQILKIINILCPEFTKIKDIQFLIDKTIYN